MSVVGLFLDRRTWLGATASLLLALAGIALGAGLLLRGWLPLSAQQIWVCGCWTLSAFGGLRWALRSREGGTVPAALASALLLYTFLWVLSLCLGGTDFSSGGPAVTAALLTGALAAGLMGPRRQKKRRSPHRRASRRR